VRVKDIAAALGRRWWLVLIGLLAAGGMVYGVFRYFPATYEITSRVLLLPPKSTVLETGNPYLQLGGLREAVDTLGVTLTDQATLLDLKRISEHATVDVRADPNGSAPILLISIQDESPDAARLIRDRLLALVDSRLDGLQRGIGVPASNRVTSTIVSSDVEAEEVGHDQLRAAVAVGVGGVALTLILAIVVDAAVLRRRERRRLGPPSRARIRRAKDPDPAEGNLDAETTAEPDESVTGSDDASALHEAADGDTDSGRPGRRSHKAATSHRVKMPPKSEPPRVKDTEPVPDDLPLTEPVG
jgi:hypothetical protein